MDGNYFKEDDLADLLREMEESAEEEPAVDEKEMNASQRRYQEIIRKYKKPENSES